MDLATVSLPGFLAIIFIKIFHSELGAIILTAIAIGFLDSGHVYTTFYRLWIYYNSSRQRLFLLWPLLICILVFTWTMLQLPYLWSCVLYATLFHNIRQFYGFLRWYEKLNGTDRRASHFTFYALLILPVLIYHVRPNVPRGVFSESDILSISYLLDKQSILLAIYIIFLALTLFREYRWAKQSRIEWNRISAFFTPVAIYGICLIGGTSIQEILYPIFVAHGASYLFASIISLRRSRSTKDWTLCFSICSVVMTAICFGMTEGLFEDEFLGTFIRYWEYSPSVLSSGVIAIYLTPLLSHYIYDMWLWRYRHPDFAKIVSA